MPVVLALMLGLAAAAWGLQVPGAWVVAGLACLLVVLLLLYGRGPGRSSKDRIPDGPEEPTESGR